MVISEDLSQKSNDGEPASFPSRLPNASIVSVQLNGIANRCYEIVVKCGILNRIGQECALVLPAGARVLVVTDETLARLCLQPILKSLQGQGFAVATCIIPPGEESKSLAQAQLVYEAALEAGLGRSDAMLALGGGVVGDLTGFCASTYHRGLAVIQVPTTLVSQVDSAIGGKTGVNAGSVKNGVGTFHQPLRVIADPEILVTLPARERVAGMAEVLKYGLIETSCLQNGQTGFWERLLQAVEDKGANAALDAELIRQCAAIKAAVVMADETETLGLRFFLNLGHTFGHAYESLSQYGFLHGEAVAIGLLKAVQLAVVLGDFPREEEMRLRTALRQLSLDGVLANAATYEPKALLAKMRQDKKNHHGQIRLILPTSKPGTVKVRTDVPETEILKILPAS